MLNKGKKDESSGGSIQPPTLTPEVAKSINQSTISKVVKSGNKTSTTTTTLIHDPSAASASSSKVTTKDDAGEVDEKFGVKKPSEQEEQKFRQELVS